MQNYRDFKKDSNMDMFRYGVVCSLEKEVSREAPIVLRGDIDYLVRTAKEIGYEGIELQVRDPQRFDAKNLRAVADQAGLAFTAIATGRELSENGLSLIDDDSVARRAAIDKLKLHIDMGEVIGAPIIIGIIRSKIADPGKVNYYMERLGKAVLELTDYAAKKNVVVLVENVLSLFSNYLNTMRQVMDFIVKLDRPNLRVHLDTYSMLMEDNCIRSAVEYCAPKLAYVHFSDSARLFPGGGNVDFKTHMKALLNVGYRGWVATECVPLPDETTCARYALRYMRAMEEIVKIETAYAR